MAQIDELQACRIEVLRRAVQTCEANQIGRSLNKGDKASLMLFRVPSLQFDSHIICAGSEEKLLPSEIRSGERPPQEPHFLQSRWGRWRAEECLCSGGP